MDAATNGRFDIIEICRDGVLRVSMPIFVSRRLGFTCISMPVYTRTLGPRFYLPPSKPFKRAQTVRNLTEELVGRLPRHDSIRIRLAPGDESVFGFSLLDFNCDQLFTFRVPCSSDLDTVWKNCDQKNAQCDPVGAEAGYGYLWIRFRGIRADIAAEQGERREQERFRGDGAHFRCGQRQETGGHRDGADRRWKGRRGRHDRMGGANAYFWQSARDPSCGIGGVNALRLWTSIELAGWD
ncbi:hypothetical protein ACLRDC_01835 [Gluconacetobacter sacchari]|uniref:hypothetical protein n=1 Tax=Gluconacetobacter sacchari TaxID=92759 RepID=UPI0039B41BAB